MNKKISIFFILKIFMIINFIITPLTLACTGFTASYNDTILVGNNEDLSLLADPQLRIFPPSGNNYGCAIFYCKWPYPFNTGRYSAFGGINDQGLFFDIFSTPNLELTNPNDKPTFNQDIFAYCIRTCKTIDEVVDVFDDYYIPYMNDIQGFFVDKSGNSVIIEGDEKIYKQGNYQVVTNFYQSNPSLGGYPCWRYNTAVLMLDNITNLTMKNFTNISEAVHMDRIVLPTFILDTIYSNICDLNQGKMYIYFFHDYTHKVEIQLPEIFEHGIQIYDLALMFEKNLSHNPNKPNTLVGETSGKIRREYEYSATGTDDDGDLLFYLFDWGDGSNSGWIGYYDSGETCIESHIWSEEGNYEIKIKTKDFYGHESEWSDPLVVSMPKTKLKANFNPWIIRLIQRFPFIENLL